MAPRLAGKGGPIHEESPPAAGAREIVAEEIWIFAKTPRLGRVKTRLQPVHSAEESLALHRAFVLDTVQLALESKAARVRVAFSEAGQGGFSLPLGVEVELQRGTGLGERLAEASTQAFRRGVSKLVFLGTDSPDLDPLVIRAAFLELDRHDLVLGPAEDGGYYLLGLSDAHVGVFSEVSWGTDAVMGQTKRNAKLLGLSVAELPKWYDVDRPEDLQRLAGGIRSRLLGGLPYPRNTAEVLKRRHLLGTGSGQRLG